MLHGVGNRFAILRKLVSRPDEIGNLMAWERECFVSMPIERCDQPKPCSLSLSACAKEFPALAKRAKVNVEFVRF
jgi:hypothetical protein